MHLNQLLKIANAKGFEIFGVNLDGETVVIKEFGATVDFSEAYRDYHPVDGYLAKGHGSLYQDVGLMPGGVKLTEAGRNTLMAVFTELRIQRALVTIKPHLSTILEAYPEAKLYVARNVELLKKSEPDVVAAFGHYEHPDSSLTMLKGFAAHGNLSYAEVEAWRYQEISLPE